MKIERLTRWPDFWNFNPKEHRNRVHTNEVIFGNSPSYFKSFGNSIYSVLWLIRFRILLIIFEHITNIFSLINFYYFFWKDLFSLVLVTKPKLIILDSFWGEYTNVAPHCFLAIDLPLFGAHWRRNQINKGTNYIFRFQWETPHNGLRITDNFVWYSCFEGRSICTVVLYSVVLEND